jgi:hypothetical protein
MTANIVVVNSAEMAIEVTLATIEGRKKSHEQRWASEHSWN